MNIKTILVASIAILTPISAFAQGSAGSSVGMAGSTSTDTHSRTKSGTANCMSGNAMSGKQSAGNNGMSNNGMNNNGANNAMADSANCNRSGSGGSSSMSGNNSGAMPNATNH